MHLLGITDLGSGRVQVSWTRSNQHRSYPHPLPFDNPLTDQDRYDLRWYLEDYLLFPFGAERNRAEQAAQRMAAWGEALFRQTFAAGDPMTGPTIYYQEAVREGLGNCEICISSDDPAFLNIPWELLRDPTPGRGYLATSLGGLYRQRCAQAIPAPLPVAQGQPFRILLVIARPYGQRDVRLGTVARPVLEALRPFRPRVELEILRPPTFEAMVRRLSDQPGYFQLVHFDGHGAFQQDPANSAILHYGGRIGHGRLVFETQDGNPDEVECSRLSQTLADCRVPLFVLNACQSAEEGTQDRFASVAASLVAVGAKGVVAMSYSVLAQTAGRFMGRFYERLVNHATLSQAVGAARQTLLAGPERDSVVGPLPLQDWMVPVLYQQESQYVPISPDVQAPPVDPKQQEFREALRQQVEAVCPAGKYGFIGRDYDILQIERKLRPDQFPWALLTGVGGTGKTEMARGFARWYSETGGCPGGVFACSFKEKADFGQVIGSIVGLATDFSRLPDQQQWDRLVGFLRDQPCLLIWDNFEPVAGYPEGARPLASDAERARLAAFLKALQGGRSRVIITTRKPEEGWLSIAYGLLELKGLVSQDTNELARLILRTIGKQPEDFRDDPDYGRLLRLLQGHPRSLELVLPPLRRHSPRQVMDLLQHRIDTAGEPLEDATLAVAFSQMSERARAHLPLLGLFAAYVRAPIVGRFHQWVQAGSEPLRRTLGGSLSEADWHDVLEEASRNGLAECVGSSLYWLPPTLTPFLRRQLAQRCGADLLGNLDEGFLEFYAAWAASFFEQARKADPKAMVAVRIEEASLLRALHLAQMRTRWEPAQPILQILCVSYEAEGRLAEWRSLRRHWLEAVGQRLGPDADRQRADLWMFLLGSEANDALGRNEIDVAEEAYQRILDFLLSLRDPAVDDRVGIAYRQLGRIAQERQRFDEAEAWYRKALAIDERLGLERYAATDYHQLGRIAEERQRFDEAEAWYRKALEIHERLGLERDAASDYHQLGRIAQERQRFDEAEEWYRKALEIFERLGLERDAADEYYQLGIIAQERQRFDEAEAWHRKALETFERLGLERYAANDYHELGIIAQERQRFDQAEAWYRKALETFERLGHPPLMVDTLAQLGVLRRKQERKGEAVASLGKALAIAGQYEMRVARQILADLARLLREMGEEAFTRCWREAFQSDPPPDVLR